MPQDGRGSWLSPEAVRALALAAFAAVVAWLCWLLVAPLAGPIAWALALAIVAQPVHARLLRLLRFKSLAAATATLLVAVTLVVPATLAGNQVAQEAVAAATKVKANMKDGHWRELADRNPRVAAAIVWLDDAVDLRAQLAKLSAEVPKAVQAVMTGGLHVVVGAGVALFLLFFFLRDRETMLGGIRALLPLSEEEAGQVFRSVDDTIYAILYGTLAVCVVQGALGSLAFWWLDLPSPLLWGSAMALLSIVPVIGTAIIWGPAAVYLLVEGGPDKALMLALWGFLVIGLVDNLLKPAIVQDRLRAHIVPVFVSILGGLAAFGASGVIIGPVVLSVALALVDIRRERTAVR